MGRMAFTLVSIALMSALGACSAAHTVLPATSPSVPVKVQQVVTVHLTDHGFQFTPDQIRPGETRFVVQNDSTVSAHEIFLVKSDLLADELPEAADGNGVDEEALEAVKLGAVEDLEPGKSGEMVVQLNAGRYIYFGNQPGDYRMGMRGELTVAP